MNLGLFVLRIVVGALFAGHGAQKLFGYFGGAGIDGTARFFEGAGLRPGRLHAYAAGGAELAGGLLLALGLLTSFAAAALIAVMTAAVITVHFRNGLWNSGGGFEFNLVLVAAAFTLAAVGPGAWSLDHAIGIGDFGVVWALAALVAGLLGGAGAVVSGHLQTEHGHEPGIHST